MKKKEKILMLKAIKDLEHMYVNLEHSSSLCPLCRASNESDCKNCPNVAFNKKMFSKTGCIERLFSFTNSTSFNTHQSLHSEFWEEVYKYLKRVPAKYWYTEKVLQRIRDIATSVYNIQ